MNVKSGAKMMLKKDCNAEDLGVDRGKKPDMKTGLRSIEWGVTG